MKICLKKPLVVSLYCHIFQAERSVGFALGAPWPEFLEYYQGERIAGVKRLAAILNETVERHRIPLVPRSRQEMAKRAPAQSIFYLLFGRWINNRRSAWRFSSEIIAFMALNLQDLVSVLELVMRPDQDQLISLRMNLCYCRSVIEICCHGLDEIRRARELEHFWKAPWMVPIPMSDIIGEEPWEDMPRKRAAG